MSLIEALTPVLIISQILGLSSYSIDLKKQFKHSKVRQIYSVVVYTFSLIFVIFAGYCTFEIVKIVGKFLKQLYQIVPYLLHISSLSTGYVIIALNNSKTYSGLNRLLKLKLPSWEESPKTKIKILKCQNIALTYTPLIYLLIIIVVTFYKFDLINMNNHFSAMNFNFTSLFITSVIVAQFESFTNVIRFIWERMHNTIQSFYMCKYSNKHILGSLKGLAKTAMVVGDVADDINLIYAVTNFLFLFLMFAEASFATCMTVLEPHFDLVYACWFIYYTSELIMLTAVPHFTMKKVRIILC